MANYGFITVSSRAVVLRPISVFDPVKDWFWRIENRKMPHLYFVGRKN
ncbi:MAG: hypothetical protein ACPGUC_05730 [Gammaproteobacteria bacterium]